MQFFSDLLNERIRWCSPCGTSVGYGALYNWWAATGYDIVIYTGYGVFYNWYAVSYNVGGASIAPVGWHVPTGLEQFPSDMDWRIMLKFISPPWGWDASHFLREVGTTHWTPPNTGATNSSKFTALPSGLRNQTGTFQLSGLCTYYWISDPWILGDVMAFDESIATGTANIGAKGGASVRLVKDSTILTDGLTSTMTDYDGNVYPTICIGTQEWMQSNLKVTHYNNGVAIPEVQNDAAWGALATGAYCWYNNIPL